MWIYYLQNIQTKDYNKVSRFFVQHFPKKVPYSQMLVVKCLLEHYCGKKSRRYISNKYWISHSTLYQIHKKIEFTALVYHVFSYLIERSIIVYVPHGQRALFSWNHSKKPSQKQLETFRIHKSVNWHISSAKIVE